MEWRCFDSTLHPGRAAAYVDLCLAVSAQAIAQRSTVMDKTHSESCGSLVTITDAALLKV